MAAVQDGYLLNKSVIRSPVGGLALTRCTQAGVLVRGGIIRPRYTFKRTERAPGEFMVRLMQRQKLCSCVPHTDVLYLLH